MNRYIVSEPPGQLLLTVQPASRLPNLIGLPILCAVLLVVAGFVSVFVFRYMPAAWPIPVIFILVLLIYLAIIIRDYSKERSLSASGEVYRFDRTHNAFTHNGVLLAVLDQIETVQVRKVVGRYVSYSLNLVLNNGSDVSIPAIYQGEIESLAPIIGKYLGLGVSYDNSY